MISNAGFTPRKSFISAKTYKIVQRIIAGATGLVIIGVGLNIVVMQTLGSFSAASVLLALYLGFLAYALGSVVLIVLSIWLFVSTKFSFRERSSVTPEIEEHGGVGRDIMSPKKAA